MRKTLYILGLFLIIGMISSASNAVVRREKTNETAEITRNAGRSGVAKQSNKVGRSGQKEISRNTSSRKTIGRSGKTTGRSGRGNGRGETSRGGRSRIVAAGVTAVKAATTTESGDNDSDNEDNNDEEIQDNITEITETTEEIVESVVKPTETTVVAEENIVIDIPKVEEEKDSFSFERFTLSLNYTLNEIENKINQKYKNAKSAKDNLFLTENSKLGVSDCTKQFTACMKSPSACGGGYSQCAGMTSLEVQAKQSYCKDILSQCRDNVIEDVLDVVYREIGIKVRSVDFEKAGKCIEEIEQCMIPVCSSGMGHEFDLCSDLTTIGDVRNSCAHVIDPCEEINPGVFRSVEGKLLDRLKKIKEAQEELKAAQTEEEKACTDMGGEVVGGKCQFLIELKNGGDVIQTKIMYAGETLQCNSGTFGIDPIKDIEEKYDAKTKKATMIAGAAGLVAGAAVGGLAQAKANGVIGNKDKAEKEDKESKQKEMSKRTCKKAGGTWDRNTKTCAGINVEETVDLKEVQTSEGYIVSTEPLAESEITEVEEGDEEVDLNVIKDEISAIRDNGQAKCDQLGADKCDKDSLDNLYVLADNASNETSLENLQELKSQAEESFNDLELIVETPKKETLKNVSKNDLTTSQLIEYKSLGGVLGTGKAPTFIKSEGSFKPGVNVLMKNGEYKTYSNQNFTLKGGFVKVMSRGKYSVWDAKTGNRLFDKGEPVNAVIASKYELESNGNIKIKG